MATDFKNTITKLNSENYFNWRYKMEMLLREKGAWSAIKDAVPSPVTADWTTKDEKAHSCIALLVEDSQIQHIRNCKSAKGAWDALKEFHEKDTPGNRVFVLRTIMRQRLEEGGNVEEHVNKMNELFQKLLSLGDEIKPEFFISATLLGSLPESYDGLITALEARSEEELSSSLVRSKIIAEYKRRMDRSTNGSEEAALKVSIKAKPETECYFCKEKGHVRKYCSKFRASRRNESKGYKSQKANMVNKESDDEFLFATGKCDGWILDSGATCHIVGKKELFIELDLSHREKVCVANGQEIVSEGKGSVRVAFLNAAGTKTSVRLENVLFMPGIDGNLISVKKLTEKGHRVSFDGENCEIRTGDNKRQIAVGDICGKLYKLREPQRAYIASERVSMCAHQWHAIAR